MNRPGPSDEGFWRWEDLTDDERLRIMPQTNETLLAAGNVGFYWGLDVWKGLEPRCEVAHVYELGWEFCVVCGPRRPVKVRNVPIERLRPPPAAPPRGQIPLARRRRGHRPVGYRWRRRFYSRARWLDYLAEVANDQLLARQRTVYVDDEPVRRSA